MTQQYEMPPLPKLPMNDPAAAHKILNDYGKACANAAIKADRKQHDRMLAHEWIRPALGLSEDAPYRFDFYAQEIEKLKADRKRRGESVTCFKCGHAKHGGEGVNVAPQPASYCTMGKHACSDPSQCWEPCGELGKSSEHAKVAEPEKVPSDAEETLREICDIFHIGSAARDRLTVLTNVRNAFDRSKRLYEIEHARESGWQLVPKEPTLIMMYAGVEEWSTRDDSEEDVQGIWEAMLEAAPKFGEEK